jgi:tetratricopeptide (TPR) repeat protein
MSSFFGKWIKGDTTAGPASNKFNALFLKARDTAAAQDFQRAIQLYDQAIAVDDSCAEAYYKRANALKDLGRPSAALANYNQAISLKPDYAYAYCNRGVVQHSLGQLAEALSSYDEAIALDTTDSVAHYNRALLMQDCFRWNEALASYDQAIAINPGYGDAQYNRAMLLLFLGQFESGWRGFEWRWKNARRLAIGDARNFKEPLWLGEEPIAGKRVLLPFIPDWRWLLDRDDSPWYPTLKVCRQESVDVLTRVAVASRQLLIGSTDEQ